MKKNQGFLPERNNATLELNLPHYCTIILVNYEKFFPSIFGYLVLTYLSYFWNFLNIDLVSELELVSKELNHFGVIAGLFWQIGSHSSRFVLFCSF